jgi:hypothetical protein
MYRVRLLVEKHDNVLSSPTPGIGRLDASVLCPIARPVVSSRRLTHRSEPRRVSNDGVETWERSPTPTIRSDETAKGEEPRCTICLVNRAIFAVKECGHVVTCNECNEHLLKTGPKPLRCPICCQEIKEPMLRLYY